MHTAQHGEMEKPIRLGSTPSSGATSLRSAAYLTISSTTPNSTPGCGFVLQSSETSRNGKCTRLVFLGDDAKGTALEVMAVELMAVELDDRSLLVIHAMSLRDRYRKQYEEVKNGEAREGHHQPLF